jgi:hypothetical protein
MSALLAVVVAAAVVAGMIWLLRAARETQRRADFVRRIQARKLGWRYDGRHDGRIDYRFSGGAHGIEWAMWRDSDRDDDSPTPKSIWTSGNVRSAELALVILGRRRFALESGVIGRMLMGAAAGIVQAIDGRASRADKAEFYESAIEIHAADTGFHERFSVAIAPGMPRLWLDTEVRRLLTRWPDAPAARPFRPENQIEVTLRADGLRIVVEKMPEDMVFWIQLAQLGETLARRLAAGAPPASEAAAPAAALRAPSAASADS